MDRVGGQEQLEGSTGVAEPDKASPGHTPIRYFCPQGLAPPQPSEPCHPVPSGHFREVSCQACHPARAALCPRLRSKDVICP